MGVKDLLDPVAIVWLLLVAGAIRRVMKRKSGAWKLVVLLFLLPAIEAGRVPERLVASLEAPYRNGSDARQAAMTVGCQAVVVCGGILQPSSDDFAGANCSDVIDRFLTGVEMARRLRCPLVLSAGAAKDCSESAFFKRWIEEWNLSGLDVRELGSCRDTRDEATAALAMARDQQWTKVMLVTSAWHLPRAAAVFRRAGLEVVPFGCDFKGTSSLRSSRVKLLPSWDSASKWHTWITEVVGLVYYRLRGWA